MLYARFSHPDDGRDYERKVASKVLKVGEISSTRYPNGVMVYKRLSLWL